MIIFIKIILLTSILCCQLSFADSFDKVMNSIERTSIFSDPNVKLREDIINLGRSTRHNFNRSDIRFEKERIIIEANCRRTNIQSTIVKTFWMCGRTLSRTNIYFPEVVVILHVSKNDNILIVSANGSDVIKLGSRNISNYEFNKVFLKKINVYTQNSK